jgi:hypothetical protein
MALLPGEMPRMGLCSVIIDIIFARSSRYKELSLSTAVLVIHLLIWHAWSCTYTLYKHCKPKKYIEALEESVCMIEIKT